MTFQEKQPAISSLIQTAFLGLAFSTFVHLPEVSINNLTTQRLLENVTASRVGSLPGEKQLWEKMRIERIRAIKGKYAAIPTSSEEFALRKREELSKED